MIAALFFSLWLAAIAAWAGWCARLARFEIAQMHQWCPLPRSVMWRIVFADYLLAPVAMVGLWLILFFVYPWEARCVPFP